MPESMKLASIWVVWGVISLGALGWGLKVILAAVGSLKDMAAWVQAVGSIGAILAAVWISRRGVWQQKQDKLLDSYDYMNKSFSVATYASQVISGAGDYIVQGVPSKPMLEYHISLLDVALDDLKEVDYIRLEDTEVADAFLSVKRAVNLTKSTIEFTLRAKNGVFDSGQVSLWGPHAVSEADRMKDSMLQYVGNHPLLLDEVHARLVKNKQ